MGYPVCCLSCRALLAIIYLKLMHARAKETASVLHASGSTGRYPIIPGSSLEELEKPRMVPRLQVQEGEVRVVRCALRVALCYVAFRKMLLRNWACVLGNHSGDFLAWLSNRL